MSHEMQQSHVGCGIMSSNFEFELLTQYIGINLYQKGFSVLKRAVAGVMTVTLTEGPHHQL
jgi:hypothetical protein